MTPERLAMLVKGRARQLDQSQWFSAERIAAEQRQSLELLTFHLAQASPGFARRLKRAGIKADRLHQPGVLAGLPPLTRRELQSAPDMFCKTVPESHRPVGKTQTSGSTGEPVVVRRTLVNQVDWLALTLREHEWYASDFTRPLASARATLPKVERHESWGAPVSFVAESGPSLTLPINLPAPEIFAQLDALRPGQLQIYPGCLALLLDHMAAHGLTLPGIDRLRSIGETLRPELRARAEQMLGARVSDLYSSQELGPIALECPVSGLYHTMAETVLVEVLDDAGNACREGEIGRVVITDLRNYATPLVRYLIGDRAEVGPPCPCGRGLPTLARVLGRERNLLLMPDGGRVWPLVGFYRFRELAPISQYQFIQHGADDIEVRLAVEQPVTAAQEAALTEVIHAALQHPFALRFSYFDLTLPLPPSGKREEFVCLI